MYRKGIIPVMFGLALSLLPAATVRADMEAGLVGYWPLNGDGQDASGNNLHGTVSKATPVADRLGYPDSAMSFTGAADCSVNLKDPVELRLTGAMTLAAWVNLKKGNTNNCRIIAKSGGGGARSFSLNIEATSGGVTFPATFQIGTGGGASNMSVLDKKPLATDEWAHMVGIYRPGEVMEVYVNGELRNTNTTSIPATQHTANNLAVLIGNRHAATNCGWNGLIDEARIYGRALSAADVTDLFKYVPTPRLKAWSPKPADGAEGVENPLLEWKPGTTAVLHNVYVGTDPNLTAANLIGPKVALLMHWYAPGLTPGVTYYWRVDEIEADGTTTHTGDVWSFTALPAVAYHPTPADGDNQVALGSTLSWRAGMSATQHKVYFGTSLDAVTQGLPSAEKGTQKELTLAPGMLEAATVYYWRVDEITADGKVQAGPIWAFATFLGVDDFESYTDDEGGRIYETWIDGWTNSTGSTVGNVKAPFAEQTVVHGGKQSMPMDYNNVNAPYYSEAERSWTSQQNWTTDGVDTLVLYVRGRTANANEALYLVVEDSAGKKATVKYADNAVFKATAWAQWKIPLSDVSAAGVNLARVKKLVIGVGNRTNPAKGGAGRLYIDDIRLLRPAPAQP
ncbi:MAG: LamG domain-containing protein [Planctomycetes bacterium]|nr:LamG domain-containing protein [Planctomycetota bacterium]